MSSTASSAAGITAIVLAGGLGTRLRSVVPDLPKPMAPVGGRPFLEHQLDYWIDQGVGRFVLSVGYRHEVVRAHFGDSYRGVPVAYAVETVPLGTGGGLLLAVGQLLDDEPFLLLNGDTFFAVELATLRAFAAARAADCCLALFAAEPGDRYLGVDVDAEGRIRSLRAGDTVGSRMINGGVYLIRPAALRAAGFVGVPAMPLSLESDVFPACLALGQRFHGMRSDGRFIDIGVPHDYHRAISVVAPHPEQLA
jgi:D-glycero-alpha-D-manno-heptose 1-phosphate guanylyltransferase